MDFNEKELRKKIRSDLEQQHRSRVNNNQQEEEAAEPAVSGLSDETIKRYIRRSLREKLYSSHPQFIKCANHLNEYEWLTEEEIKNQYEFYPVDETWWQRFKNYFSSDPLKKVPHLEWMEDYRREIEKEIRENIDKRIQELRRKQEELRQRARESRVAEIISEEEEEFYRNHPDYRQYKNWAGETRWMTEEEYLAQDEFTIEVKTTRQKIMIGAAWSLAALIVIGALYWLNATFGAQAQKGYLIIESNEQRGQLYINENQVVGFNPGSVISLDPGKYKINFHMADRVSEPKFQIVSITRGDTVHSWFELKPLDTSRKAVVRIASNFDDAKIFVDGEFLGIVRNFDRLLLEPGKHKIMLQKENYETNPPIQNILLKEGDTLQLQFRHLPKSDGKQRATQVTHALLEVSSNIRGAKIFLDGRDTGFETDHILNRVPAGKHIVSVQKTGYRVYPREKEVDIRGRNQIEKINFKLSRINVPVRITTRPVNGTIYIDGREIGNGDWSGNLTLGEHKVQFGNVNFYTPPEAQTINISEEGATEFVFLYKNAFSIKFSTNGIAPASIIGAIQLGYLIEDRRFYIDPSNGPEIVIDSNFRQRVWKLGSAFAYRNPPEGDAILLSFMIPQQVPINANIKLKIWGYRSDEPYPLALKKISRVRIRVNDSVVRDNHTPRYSLSEAGPTVYEQFTIGDLLKYGKNSVEIGVTSENTLFYIIEKVAVE